MSFETPFVEYLIVGTHTSIWLVLVIMAIFHIPPEALLTINVGAIVPLIPIAYLLGALFSTLTSYILNPFRKKIRNSIFSYEQYKDETIAYHSSELYAAYSVRMHRVRLMGPSIFNWLFLGIALPVYVGFLNPPIYIVAFVIPTLLSVLTAVAWRFLLIRALEFRKNAIDVIRNEAKSIILPKQRKKNFRVAVKD